MIYESQYWKEDLLRFAKILKRRRRQERWPERSVARVEKEIFYAFYAIRKLLEAKKLSARIINRRVPVRVFPSTGKPVTLLNWDWKFDQAYDLKKGKKKSVALSFACNQIVHSYVFIIVLGAKGGLQGLFFCSDFYRQRNICYVEIRDVIRLLLKVGSDYPHSGRSTFDEKTGDWTVHLW